MNTQDDKSPEEMIADSDQEQETNGRPLEMEARLGLKVSGKWPSPKVIAYVLAALSAAIYALIKFLQSLPIDVEP